MAGGLTGVAILTDTSTERMDSAFGTAASGIRVAPASLIPPDRNEVQVWCLRNGVYQVPTRELVEVLRELSGGLKTIEICAGHGAIARALGITATDSYVQTTPAMRRIYAEMRQPITEPPPDVQRLEAVEAVRVHDPEVVLGCFVTQLGTSEVPQSSPVGVDETALLEHPSVRRYVMVGNSAVHGLKTALRRPHRVLHLGAPWLASRASNPFQNCIYVWDAPACKTPSSPVRGSEESP